MQTNQDFSVTFMVDNTPQEVFAAINHVRGWWSQEVDGDTDRLGAEFKYHYRDVHRAAFKITEFVPNERVVWHVMDNYFNFIQDPTEWVGTDLVFEITEQGDQTAVRFTHVGLVPAYECFEVCSGAWSSYIVKSLRDLITTGQGQPNPIEEIVQKAQEMRAQHYMTSFRVDQSPAEVFAAVNNVRGWWSEAIEGETDKLGAEFVFRAADLHLSTQKITELVPEQKVVWLVTESQINFVEDKEEWTGTKVVFEITPQGGKTELRFTHVGLVPEVECYGQCTNAWAFYVNRSLFTLITKGKGEPTKGEAPPVAVRV